MSIVTQCVAREGFLTDDGNIYSLRALEQLRDDLIKQEHVIHAWLDDDKLMVKVDTEVLNGKRLTPHWLAC